MTDKQETPRERSLAADAAPTGDEAVIGNYSLTELLRATGMNSAADQLMQERRALMRAIVAANNERDAARAELAKARDLLGRFRHHRYCEDAWYACPKNPEYFGGRDRNVCDCWADEVCEFLGPDAPPQPGGPQP